MDASSQRKENITAPQGGPADRPVRLHRLEKADALGAREDHLFPHYELCYHSTRRYYGCSLPSPMRRSPVMPSMAHEILVDLFKNRPSLAVEILIEVLGISLPDYTEARIASADLTEIQPAEYRADIVVILFRDGNPSAWSSSRSNWRQTPKSVSVGPPM
jgi:hypothetical protein